MAYFSRVKSMFKPKAKSPSAGSSASSFASPSATASAIPFAITPEQFLELTEACKCRAQGMLTPSMDVSGSLRVNYEQCKYMAEKLELAVREAQMFLEHFQGSSVPQEETTNCLDAFKLLHSVAHAVENFIQNCCKDAWVEAAFLMPNVSQDVLAISFDLALLAAFFSGNSVIEVDSVYRAEASIVTEKAANDRHVLLGDVNALLRTEEKIIAEFRLAKLLLEKLTAPERSVAGSLSGAHRTDIESLKEGKCLGRGNNVTVYKSVWLGIDVAVKTFHRPSSQEFRNEVSILGRLSHPNVTSLFCCAEDDRECSIVMELMDRDLSGMMRDIMKDKSRKLGYPFSIIEAVNIMLQVGRGTEYLHEMKIVHRDLKAANILVRLVDRRDGESSNILAKVADFGLSKTKEKSFTYSMQTLNTGTTRWMAPEVIRMRGTEVQEEVSNDSMVVKYPYRSDVYSFGMVCYEILTGRQPYFEVESLIEIKKRILSGDRPKLPQHCPAQLKDLIKRCWSQDASKRPRFNEICTKLRNLRFELLMPDMQQRTRLQAAIRVHDEAKVADEGDGGAGHSNSVGNPRYATLPPPRKTGDGIGAWDSEGFTQDQVPASVVVNDDKWQSFTGAFVSNFVDQEASVARAPKRPPIKWVVGLDFGTTFSGFAYARADGPEEIIRVHYEWPSRTGERPYCKTWTGLYYKPSGAEGLKCASWGHIARADFMASRGWKGNGAQGLYLSKFKLLLKRDLNDPALAASVQPPLTVQSIIVDYLRCLGELALSVIQSHEGDASFSRDSVQWCVTVPSIWDETAKQQMKACMVNAGLVSAEAGGVDAVKVVLEPEAASFHCHQILREEHKDVSLKAQDKILVADVGGGTVDIVVQKLVGKGTSYEVEELTESSGGLCGGTFVDESFMRFLSKKIPCLDDFLRNDLPSYKMRLLKDWEVHKRGFDHELMSNTETKEITLHGKLARRWEEYDAAQGLPPRPNGYDEIEMTQDDLKSIFDPVVNEILELIAAQLVLVPDIKVMFVVGGFAGSPYLMQRIQARFIGDVRHIFCPKNPGSAICQGAVLVARIPDSRVISRTYGTSVTLRSAPDIDPPAYLKFGSDGVQWCRNRFDTFVQKGSRVEVNKGVTREYVPRDVGQTHMMLDLYSSTDQDPRYTEGPNVRKEGGFSVTLPRNYSSSDKPVIRLTMYFGRSSIELSAEARYKHGRAGSRPETLALPVEYHQ